jgi:thiamine-monophosphate kinase
MIEGELALGELGERRIIKDILGRRYGDRANFGDDAASLGQLNAVSGTVVATTDPCPPPMAEALGATDQFYAGWLLATLNLSDLAAAGAEPLGVLTSYLLPREMPLAAFERLLDGVDECCASVSTHVVGGNIKEGPVRDLTATAIGLCEGRQPLSRRGGAPGDQLVVIGDLGSFWAGVLAVQQGLLALRDDNALLTNVLTPQPKNVVMASIAKRGLATAAIDNSDGLFPTLLQLSDVNGLRAALNAAHFVFRDDVVNMSQRLEVDPMRLALGWGDWQVIVSCRREILDELLLEADRHGVPACVIGELTDGTGVTIEHDGRRGALLPLDSQRFTLGSWFTAGLGSYISTLLEAPLIQE